ncbi:Bug family tripartite tricarboxylate transporter substrate binding protein [Variovorax saccharolyticus]|uniref:Bug family tripartite tricarboxylate transporter substrate binding protein n=1 Tax=Variovorax saccharolyticus TaxID=3053516 RepID=UPI002574DB02|nr:tripartite tricarboxylate transporter substrate binding protein [Variovorax sp. J31P216]MDM0029525.1 tripartite tricarboxylate transporter substrate binding protein [Variovorax sp. J31P216]
MQSITRRTLLLSAACLGLQGTALAQDYPTRPIKWIVPYLAGTAPDITVRITAEAMSEILKQPVVVENKGGAAGNLGAQIAARAPADGYTWVYSATPMATNMRMYRKPGFDVMKDFIHVGGITRSDVVLVVAADSGIDSTKDLLQRMREQPDKLSYASGGVGTPAHMGAELILKTTGTRALHVPYKGASESANAVLGKQVDFALTISSVSLPHITGGKLKALAVTAPTRNPRLPEVPTLAEAGVPGVTLESYGGLSLPAGTPAPIVRRISDALQKALEDPRVRAKLEANGAGVVATKSEAYARSLESEIALTEKMMKATNVTAQ